MPFLLLYPWGHPWGVLIINTNTKSNVYVPRFQFRFLDPPPSHLQAVVGSSACAASCRPFAGLLELIFIDLKTLHEGHRWSLHFQSGVKTLRCHHRATKASTARRSLGWGQPVYLRGARLYPWIWKIFPWEHDPAGRCWITYKMLVRRHLDVRRQRENLMLVTDLLQWTALITNTERGVS